MKWYTLLYGQSVIDHHDIVFFIPLVYGAASYSRQMMTSAALLQKHKSCVIIFLMNTFIQSLCHTA